MLMPVPYVRVLPAITSLSCLFLRAAHYYSKVIHVNMKSKHDVYRAYIEVILTAQSYHPLMLG